MACGRTVMLPQPPACPCLQLCNCWQLRASKPAVVWRHGFAFQGSLLSSLLREPVRVVEEEMSLSHETRGGP